MDLHEYLRKIKKLFDSGISTEHSYRGDLQSLLNSLFKNIKVTNEPKRQKCGAPDYILQRKDVPIGYIEAKDIGFDLDKAEKSAQIKRYLRSLDNLILTDYLEFRFYRYKEKIKTIKIGSIEKGKIQALPHHFSDFESHLKDFCTFRSHTIKSAKDLAEVMAGKARMLEEVIYRLLQDRGDEDNDLVGQFKAFRKILLHDLDEKAFADVYAQTIAYGLFAARLHDKPLNDFDRQKASGLIPPSNPFLRKLFDYISGVQLDSRMVWVVDDLCQIFRATNLNTILANFGLTFSQTNAGEDPFIYFYETFLAEYNPKLRKSRGVYYTPEPVVGFIVRAVDDILKTEFALPKGLADTSKTSILQRTDMENGKKIAVHKVQILDPATGTGTFLAETIKQIHSKFKGQEGLWSSYVEEHLLPRVNGFEVLMASYTMCHLKMEMLLGQTGYRAKEKNKQKRLNVFLTNSLAEVHENTETLFASWLSKEATQANKVKRDAPIMCVLGNPPYSGESQNKGKWISELMEDYKKEPGGEIKLGERNPKWINDDYVKFLRYGQHFIEKNGSGILAFINNNGFLDNPTFRGVRWHLLKTYDNIYIIDLHGNSKKKEVAPDGSKDENVFDIMQGVSINIFVKTGQKKTGALAKVFHYDLYGRREDKYKFLLGNGIASVPYVELPNEKPNYFFVQKDFKKKKNYDKGFSVKELFLINGTGIVSKRDGIAFADSKAAIKRNIKNIYDLSYQEIKEKYKNISWDSRDGKVEFCKDNVMKCGLKDELFIKCSYRPFDIKWTYYTGVAKGFIGWPVKEIMQHFLKGENVGLITTRRQSSPENWNSIFITNKISEGHFRVDINYVFPLYLYHEPTEIENGNGYHDIEKVPNLNENIVKQIAKKLELTFTNGINEKENTKNTFAPIDILDYIYAVLHSPAYRKKYREFLKTDFTRVPYPQDKKKFWHLVKLGGKLRQVHLLESPVVGKTITQYPVDGSDEVENIVYTRGRVYISEKQYFARVPEVAWQFYIGGYQPAQKWLKDRKGRTLSHEDIVHYQKIIAALAETDKIMGKIDGVGAMPRL